MAAALVAAATGGAGGFTGAPARSARPPSRATARLATSSRPAPAATAAATAAWCWDAGSRLLLAVAVVSSADVWAVGGQRAAGMDAPERPLVERWNGRRWAIVQSPRPTGATGILYGVAALGPDDGWAVGVAGVGRGSRPLVEHWDGARWRIVDGGGSRPPSAGSGAALLAVAGEAGPGVWAVGSIAGAGGPLQPLVERWARSSGTAVSAPPGAAPLRPTASLVSVAVRAPSEVLAGGAAGDGDAQRALLERWDGRSLRAVRSVALEARMRSVTAVALTANGGAFAVGTARAFHGGSQGLEVARRSRGAWLVTPAPSPGRLYSELAAVGAASPTDAWAVGAYGDGLPPAPSGIALVEHWDGVSWRSVPIPSPGARPGFDLGLDGIAVAGRSDVWAVGGYTARRCGPTRPLVEHWNGDRWAAVPAP